MTESTIQELLALTAPKRIPGTAGADAEPPAVARSGNNVFVLWHEFPDPNNQQPDVFLARSKNGGTTFLPRINLSGTPMAFSGAENIAVSGSRVYVAWVEGAAVVFRRDLQNDGIFSSPVQLSNATTGIPDIQAGQRVQVAASGTNVFVAWQAEVPPNSGINAVFFTRSTNGGNTFQGPTKVSADNNDPRLFPDMTLVGDNRVLLAWRDVTGPVGAGAEIFYVLAP